MASAARASLLWGVDGDRASFFGVCNSVQEAGTPRLAVHEYESEAACLSSSDPAASLARLKLLKGSTLQAC